MFYLAKFLDLFGKHVCKFTVRLRGTGEALKFHVKHTHTPMLGIEPRTSCMLGMASIIMPSA